MLNFLPKTVRYKLKSVDDYFKIQKWKRKGRPSPPPHAIKQKMISSFQRKYNHKILIETGTYSGATIDSQLKNFRKIISIELSQKYFDNAVKKYQTIESVNVIHGDSGIKLFEIVPTINDSILFWLDGHYSAGDTAMGVLNCPILNELNAIIKHQKFENTILVDDARLFDGTNDYPTINELEKYVIELNPNYKMEISNDIICFEINKS